MTSVIERIRGSSLRNLILPVGDQILNMGLASRLRLLEEAQYWSRGRVREWQDSALANLMQTVYEEVPFYTRLMQGCGIGPGDISSREDLSKIPIVSKTMLREGFPENVCRRTGHRVYEARTSGSTGQNFVVLEDNETAGNYRASFLLALEWAGWKLGERHLQTGMTLPRTGLRRIKDRAFGCSYFSAFDLSDDNMDRALEVLDHKDIQHLWGYPISLAVLARRAASQCWNRTLQSVVTWGDKLDSASRRSIESVFGCRVYDTYGCGEGFQVAAQCGFGQSYHLHDLEVIVEFVDSEGGPVGPGEVGRVLITRLHAGPMPFLRYEVGDLGIPGDDIGGCGCGREWSRLEEVIGRSGDLIETPRGNRLILHFFTGIIEHFEEIEEFQIEQDQVDHLVIRVVPGIGYSSNTARRLVIALDAHGLEDMRVDVEPVREIPLSPGGKRRFVLNNLGEGGLDGK